MDTSSHTQITDRSEAIEQLRGLLDGIHVAMLVTDGSGADSVDGRPMGTQEIDDDGCLWFFSQRDAAKVEEIGRNPSVAVSYVDTSSETYVFVRGHAQVVDDRARAQELWSPVAKAWFDGPDDPQLVLVRVAVDSAEYWNTKGGRIASVLQIGARIAGMDVGEGQRGRIEVGAR